MMKRFFLPVLGISTLLTVCFFLAHTKTETGIENHAITTVESSVKEYGSAINSTPTKKATNERFTLQGSSDYAELKAYFEPLAKQGDSHASRIVAQIYEYCAMYTNPGYHFNETIDVMIKQKPENKARLETIRKEKKARCSTLDNGLPVTKELLDFTWAQASAAKDPLATLKLATQIQIKTPEKAPQGEALDLMIQQAIQDADPEVLFAAGELLGQSNSSLTYADISGPINEYAWQIAACRLGGAKMCGQGSHLMSALCLNLGDCTSPNFETMVRNSVPRSQTEMLNQALVHIEQLLQQRKQKP
jgi:hypothetical protein